MQVETELNNTVNNTHIWFNDFIQRILDTIKLACEWWGVWRESYIHIQRYN